MENRVEIWKDIEGYEGLYQISNMGRVKSLAKQTLCGHRKEQTIFRNEKFLSLRCNKKGYLQVGLSKNGIRKQFTVHRLVAQTFIPNPNNLPQVNHKDENKTNNCIENLEWCTAEYNCNYGNHKSNISNALKGHIVKKETRDKISFANSGEKNGMSSEKRLSRMKNTA